MERHESHDNDTTNSRPENPNVFDDEYAVDGSDDEFDVGVADGFRPGQSRDLESQAENDPPRGQPSTWRSALIHAAHEPAPRHAVSRNSTLKGHGARETSAMAHEAPRAVIPSRTPSMYSDGNLSGSTSAPHRSTSSASSFVTLDRTQSPFQNYAGPSHPYAMYHQGTGVARSASVTTSSTIRPPSHTYSQQQRPAHPYAMYQQSVFEDQEISPIEPQPQAIPVGFPGLNQGYHRQIGPDGEEQDIIGPDGHTEQLPPYSRFPEEGTPKIVLPELATGSAVTMAAASTNSQDALLTSGPNVRQQLEVTGPGEPPPPARPSEGLEWSEKSWKEKTWREKRKTKVLGGKISLCMFILLACVVVILAIVVGGVVGGFVSRAHDNQATPTVTITASMFDASAIPTPSDLPPLPPGKYALPLGNPQDTNKGCITNQSQLDAWSCDIALPPPGLVEMLVATPPGTTPAASVQSAPGAPLQYGSQPPQIRMGGLTLVKDFDLPDSGAAYHFSARYDKIVIVREDDIPCESLNKRNPYRPRHQLATPSERPWFCFWNNTFIEGFIYVNQSTADAAASASSVFTSSSSSSTSAPPAFSGPANQAASTAAMTVTIKQSSPAAAVATSPPYSWQPGRPWSSDMASYYANKYASMSQDMARRGAAPDLSNTRVYPRVVKIEERRLPNNPIPAYCQQMQILDNGGFNPVVDGDNNFIKVSLDETDPSSAQFASNLPAAPSGTPEVVKRASSELEELERREDPGNGCHCQWISL